MDPPPGVFVVVVGLTGTMLSLLRHTTSPTHRFFHFFHRKLQGGWGCQGMAYSPSAQPALELQLPPLGPLPLLSHHPAKLSTAAAASRKPSPTLVCPTHVPTSPSGALLAPPTSSLAFPQGAPLCLNSITHRARVNPNMPDSSFLINSGLGSAQSQLGCT